MAAQTIDPNSSMSSGPVLDLVQLARDCVVLQKREAMSDFDKLTAIARAFVTIFKKGEIPIPSEAERDEVRHNLIARIEAEIGTSVSEEEFEKTLTLGLSVLETVQRLQGH